MDLPAGTPIREGMDTGSVDFRKLFPTLSQHDLTGYLAVDIMTNNGIEEGILLLNNGEVVAAEYIYVAKEIFVRGDGALPLVMNACVGEGRFDICELGADELLYAREKNREDVLKYKPTEKELLALLPDTFTEKVPDQKTEAVIKPEKITKAGGVSREDVLKKYGISHPDAKSLDKMLTSVINS